MKLILCLVLLSFPWAASAQKAKYVFFFLGDGMGEAQRHLAEVYLGSQSPKKSEVHLNMLRMPVKGSQTTHSYDSMITDSAASATAYAAGFKSYNGAIGVDPKGRPLKSIAHYAKLAGKKIGIITTTSIDHATPGSYYAHVDSRNKYYEIGSYIAKSNFDFFASGGVRYPKGRKNDQPDIYELAKKNGFRVINTLDGFRKLNDIKRKTIVVHPSPAADASVPYAIDGVQGVGLTDLVKKGIQLLTNSRGFFMLIEGGKIDWACHANDAATAVQEVVEFDKAIGVALSFLKKHPKETLIVVTADHETGGLALGNRDQYYKMHPAILSRQHMSFRRFREAFDDYVRSRKSAHRLQDLEGLIRRGFSLVRPGTKADAGSIVASRDEWGRLEAVFKQSVLWSQDPANSRAYGGYLPLQVEITNIIAAHAGVGFTTYLHTGVPVGVYAQGVGAAAFSNRYDNTEIPRKLMAAMGIKGMKDSAERRRQALPGWQGISLK